MNPYLLASILFFTIHYYNSKIKSSITGIKLKKTKWFEPYTNGKPTLSSKYYTRPGVYFIKSKQTGKIIYIGHSATSLKKTLYRHFQTWNDNRQNRFTYSPNFYLIRIIETTAKRSAELEKYLIDKYKPKDNKNKYPTLEFTDFKEDLAAAEFFNNYKDEELPF
jgi:excinuclease UvrABC nuclease subunit